MGEAIKMPAFKLPKIHLPRPKLWDYCAIGLFLIGVLVSAVNIWRAATQPPGEPYPSWLTAVVVFTQLGVTCGGLMALGKTAKEGTGLGNLAALLASFIGMGGVLLAAALWAAA